MSALSVLAWCEKVAYLVTRMVKICVYLTNYGFGWS